MKDVEKIDFAMKLIQEVLRKYRRFPAEPVATEKQITRTKLATAYEVVGIVLDDLKGDSSELEPHG